MTCDLCFVPAVILLLFSSTCTFLVNLYILGHVLLQSSTEYYSHMVLYWTLRFIFKYVLFLFSKIITTCSLVSGYEN